MQEALVQISFSSKDLEKKEKGIAYHDFLIFAAIPFNKEPILEALISLNGMYNQGCENLRKGFTFK
ncbi:MAG: hypothetical protein ACTSVI_04895 [Promethearchaeota archaeon]